MTDSLKNKTLIVTGASSGIGHATVVELLKHQANIIGIARNFEKVAELKKQIIHYQQDLGDLKASENLFKKIVKEQQIDGLIHCAGYGRFGSLEQFSSAQITRYLDDHLNSTLMLLRQLLPRFRNQLHSDIVIIGSESALKAGKKGVLYSTVKFALRGMAQALREDCAKDGIRVSLINPGMVQSPFFDTLNFRPGDQPGESISPQDVAQTILQVLMSSPNIVFDEINLSPRNTVIQFGKPETR